ncbi:DUF3137 domain-containing protein [bacterium]|nr:DUF3137 domain-containing protein [bacterium]
MEEKTYQDIRANFENKYTNVVVPKILPLEKERKKTRKTSFIIMAAMIIIGIMLFCLSSKLIYLRFFGLLFILFSFAVRAITGKKFENKLKTLIMPYVCECFPNLKWTYATDDMLKETDIFKKSGLLSDFNNSSYDDCFIGKYNGVGFEIREFNATKETGFGKDKKTISIFDGVIVILDMNKNFKGNTVLKPHGLPDYSMTKSMSVSVSYTFGKNSKPEVEHYKSPNLRKTTLEDVEFNKKFDVYTDDEVEARYLLTTSLMERLNTMQTTFNAGKAACSFYEQKFYVALYTKKDLFSLGSLTKDVCDREQFFTMFEEIFSIIKLIDHFKLNQKIGM